MQVPIPGSRLMGRKKFSALTAREKQLVRLIPPLPRLTVTQAMLADWGNGNRYGVWIDDKRVVNTELDHYSPQDFGSYFSSKLAKNALNYGKHYYQIDLMTNQAYEAYVQEEKRNPMLVLSERPLNRR